MPDPNCVRRRMLLAARQSYDSALPMTGDYAAIGWLEPPRPFRDVSKLVDLAVVGRIDRGVLVAFRGTRPPSRHDDAALATFFDWANDAACVPVHPPTYPAPVHLGFARSIEALWSQVMVEVRRLLDLGGPHALFVTGHSKGGALAALAAWRFAHEIHPQPGVRLVTFASARPGSDGFRRAIEAEPAISATRFEVRLDPVPDLPLGPDSSPVARSLLERLPFRAGAATGYWPVGRRIRGGPNAASVAVRLFDGLVGLFSRRQGLKALLPSDLIGAHSIGVPSAYDALVCGEEVACEHD